METRIQIVAILGAALLLVVILELVRRRRLQERYALLWMGSALVLLGLAIWRGALDQVSELMGISYPPNALFFVAFAFILALLLHFSAAMSKLADQSKILAQRLALLEQRVVETERSDEAQEPATEWATVSQALVEDVAEPEPARRR